MISTISVVGARGRMGAMLCEAWSQRHTVLPVDIDASGTLPAAALANAVPQSQIVFLCVPAPVMEEVMQKVAPHMHADQILADVCSVKIIPMNIMEGAFSGAVVGTHPLFGPDNQRKGTKTALVPGKNATTAHTKTIETLFAELGTDTFVTNAAEHDKAVAVSQSLHFALSAAYFASAAAHHGLEPYLTPSFNRYKEAAKKELTVNAPMFCEFSAANPMFSEALEAVRVLLQDAKNGKLPEIAAKAAKWY